ncbi:MAG: zinc ribbon domain-containing protein [Patescibacteria group bacterium]
MPIFQFKCEDCSALFEQFMNAVGYQSEVDCMACGSGNIARPDDTSFYPNKHFCPHDKTLDMDHLKNNFSSILKDTDQRCGGCGTDGAPGRCKSGSGGCGSGGGCGGGCSCSAKKSSDPSPSHSLKLNIYDKGAF